MAVRRLARLVRRCLRHGTCLVACAAVLATAVLPVSAQPATPAPDPSADPPRDERLGEPSLQPSPEEDWSEEPISLEPEGSPEYSAVPPGVPAPPSVSAAAAILMDWRTGQVLFAKDAYKPRAPASTTKILTAIVVIENARLAEEVKVSQYAAYTPGSSMGLAPGQVVTVGELLWGMLLHSGNDACVAAAEHVAGSEKAFVELMNRRARELGARKTHFRNPHGISVLNHYTTAYDLALLARYALTLPVFETIVRTREASLELRQDSSDDLRLRNTNNLLWRFAGADGVKTGTTSVAGKCLVSSATRDGRRLLAVVLNSGDRYQDSAVLLDWGFRHYGTVCLARAGRPLATVRVRGGTSRRVRLAPDEDFWVTCPLWATNTLGLEVHLTEPARAPLRRGQVLGVAEATLDGGVVRAVNLVAEETVPAWTLTRGLLKVIVAVVRVLARLGVG